MASMRHWSVVLALGAGLVSGCIIAAGGGDSNACGSQASFSHVGADDMCYCDAGYTWENPDDEKDFDCVLVHGKGSSAAACDEPFSALYVDECFCDYGYKWCVPDDPNDYTCCIDDAQDSAGGGDDGSSDGTAGDTGDGVEPAPDDCTAAVEGAGFCSHTSAMGPEGSRYWLCTGGAWVESPAVADENCTFDGYDFAYGCVDTGGAVEFVCGNGTGSACERDSSICVDSDQIDYCLYGKLTTDSCLRICTEEGDGTMTYDSGLCDALMGECYCCDMGQEGCNV
jgi:hypothetical protein